MKLKIRHKLFLTILLTSTITAGGFFILLQWSFDRGFLNYVKAQELLLLDQLSTQLTSYYLRNGDWEFITQNHPLWKSIHRVTFAPHRADETFSRGGKINGPQFMPPHLDPRGIGPRVILFDEKKKKIIGGPDMLEENIPLRPINHEKDIIGYLGLIPITALSNEGDLLFVEQQTETFGLAALFMIGVSILLTFPVTVHLLRPINELAGATRKLISGHFKTRIPAISGDELGQLSADFNIMAMTLEKNEHARKRWVADISHELRTPLAVLRGDVEALQDGIRNPGPETFEPLHAEILHLERLVSDLYELSMSDIGALTYRKIEVDPIGILEETVELFEIRYKEKALGLSVDTFDINTSLLLGDPDRLQQLFTNLLENSLRYTDPPGGLTILVEQKQNLLRIIFEDSSPSVKPEQLEKLFDRLFRADDSRNRESGGAGLGLAICKNIVDAHAGRIFADNSPQGGLKFSIELPLTI